MSGLFIVQSRYFNIFCGF